MQKRALVRTGILYGGTALASIAIVFWALELWRADFSFPIAGKLHDDIIEFLAFIKGMRETGWFFTNPSIGMPTGLDFRAFPITENLYVTAIKIALLCGAGPAAALNAYYLATFPLTAMSALYVFRRLGHATAPAVAGSLLYTALPYHFLRGEDHILLAGYFLVPLGVLVALRIGEGALTRVEGAVILGLTAMGGIYYAAFALFFFAIAAIAGTIATRDRRPLLQGLAASAFLTVATALNGWQSILTSYRDGSSLNLVKREPGDATPYSLSLIQLISPYRHHRLEWAREWTNEIATRMSGFFSSGESQNVTLGLIATIGFFVLWYRLLFARRERDRLAVFNACAVLLAVPGGLGTAVVFGVTAMIRAYNRISVFIAFFALAAIVDWLSRLPRQWAGVTTFASIAMVLFGVWDQTTPHFVPGYAERKREMIEDRLFVQRLEHALPAGTMVFQLPYVPFHEGTNPHMMLGYDHFRMYLQSDSLRWSFGAMRGGIADYLQSRIADVPTREDLDRLALIGFGAVYVDRNGYADGGAAVERRLKELLGPASACADEGHRAGYVLAGYTRALRAAIAPGEWERRRTELFESLYVTLGSGFWAQEGPRKHPWGWVSSREASLYVNNPSAKTVHASIGFEIFTAAHGPSRIRLRGALAGALDGQWLPASQNARPFALAAVIPPGRHRIRITSDAQPIFQPGDYRSSLRFQVRDFAVKPVDDVPVLP